MFNGVQVLSPARAARSLPENTSREHKQRTPPENAARERMLRTRRAHLHRLPATSCERRKIKDMKNPGHSKRDEAPQKIWEPHPVAYRIRRLRLSGEPEQSCGCSGYRQSGTPRYRGRHRYQPQGTSQQSEQQKCTRRACPARTGQPPRRLRYR